MYSYQRMSWGFGGGGMTDAVKKLLIANGVVFVLQMFMGPVLTLHFGLVPKLAWSRLYVWQFVTYLFLHGGLLHLGLNMYALYMFGSEVERMWGSKAFLQYYFITGIGAGAIHTLITPFSMAPTIGASGAIAGVLVAYALMYPRNEITLMFFFRVQARTLAIGYALISVLSGVAGSPDGIAHFAHLGGMLVGYLYLKRGSSLDLFKSRFHQWQRESNMRVVREREKEVEKLRRLADAVLDKANAVGFENLTRDEKRILKRAAEVLKNEKKYNR